MASVPDGDRRQEESTPPEAGAEKAENEKNSPRRQFLKLSLALGLLLAVGGVASVARSLFSPSSPEPAPPTASSQTVTETVTASSGGASSTTTESSTSTTTTSPFPSVLVANISDLVEGQPVYFQYPLDVLGQPNLLVKLGVQAEGGVGPDADIVAFSQVCQHLGCDVGYVAAGDSPACTNSYKATGPVAYCCCHGSVYDFVNGAKVIGGPAPRPLPQVTLEFDSSTGNIYAIGMGPPTIYGYDTGSNNVLYDLQGGTPA